MGPIGSILSEQVAAIVVHEALDEMRGRSNKKWALLILGLVVGAAIAGWVIRRRQQQVVDEITVDGSMAQVRHA